MTTPTLTLRELLLAYRERHRDRYDGQSDCIGPDRCELCVQADEALAASAPSPEPQVAEK